MALSHAFPGPGPSQGHIVQGFDLTQDDDGEEDTIDALELVGSFRTKVVGVRYYNGEANKDEMVLLVREPNNPYDRWAIRVDNVRGEKIGHISREQAAVMSPLIDRGQLRIEGLVQGAKGAFTMPIDLFCFTSPADGEAVAKRLRGGGILLVRSQGGRGGPSGAGQAQGSAAGTRPMTQSELDTSLERMFDEVHTTGALQPAMEPDGEVLSRLYPHQRVALAWMVTRENDCGLPPFWEEQRPRGGGGVRYLNTLTNFSVSEKPQPLRGGILADDMGLGMWLGRGRVNIDETDRCRPAGMRAISEICGKTLTLISLIATNRPGVQLPPFQMISLGGEDNDGSSGGGGAAAATAMAVAAAAVPPPLQQQPVAAVVAVAGKRGRNRKAREAAAADADEDDMPQPKRRKIQEHTAGNLKVYQYHGPDRSRSPSFLASHDVVLTTYSVLGGDLADGRGLLSVKWLRVVLDEAHAVKNPRAKWSQAAAKLKAERKWAVTGTPIQNRLRDLHGLVCYLGLEPLQERSIFTRVLERPLKDCDPRAVKKLQVLMRTIAMRRTKDLQINGRPLVVLPRKTINIVTVHLTREDRVKYDALELQGRQVIAHALQSQTLLENYMSVLEIILRLRQVADAGCLCTRDPLPLTEAAAAAAAPAAAGARQQVGPALTDAERHSLVELLTAGLQDDCPICMESLNQTACITRCRHIFCKACIENVIARAAGPGCPMCRTKITMLDIVELPPDAATEQLTQAGSDVADPEGASAKVAALMAALRSAAAQQPMYGSGGPIKSVVFSQFTGMLNLVGRALEAAGMRYVRLDGCTPAKARADMVRDFARREPDSPVVFLVSLKAGGVGMNLTAASHVHLLDPWWNPSVEEQAMDRVHRLGQTRDVEVFRYVAADTIEERMLLLQERKRELANAAFDRRSAEQNRQMRIDDVKLLMDL
ncbi:hypothetical protein VOLCADRAFT_115608 [Volvox carteri f. nagariensis]|uniref:SNF2 super family n=1 Tax=Volvox carteri f. nagariensis TaxID=3068 RepID=D8TH63_VOLCA|nr:uncharacterized protein VOLCADRAFT_115608 [Volvox carteri f. nagariensis]EFJ52656.1 hypothetical protein VOLCADRAFT_115608 [Volvox carteri f. nagariensis]|eukprot:XP_002945661.1 hypothetical protein VOLCADRAFT_115608 [Volvox carteri f. nagariensis]